MTMFITTHLHVYEYSLELFSFQLCITINDIEQVRRSLKPLPDALKFNDIIKHTERTMGETNAKGARMQLFSIIKHADDNMIRRIKQVVDKVADRVRFLLCFLAMFYDQFQVEIRRNVKIIINKIVLGIIWSV